MIVIPADYEAADLDRLDAWPVDVGGAMLAVSAGVWHDKSFPNRVIHVYPHLGLPKWNLKVPRYRAEDKRHRFAFASQIHKVVGAPLPDCLRHVDAAEGDWWRACCAAIAEHTQRRRREAEDYAEARKTPPDGHPALLPRMDILARNFVKGA